MQGVAGRPRARFPQTAHGAGARLPPKPSAFQPTRRSTVAACRR